MAPAHGLPEDHLQRPYPSEAPCENPRTHTARQIQQIATSIGEFGFISPVLIDGSNGIIAGHGRVLAAKSLGMADVPTVRVDHLTPAQIRAYVIADNKLAENAGWDRTLLALELKELSVELNFDVTITGFEIGEVDILIGELSVGASEEEDAIPEIDRSIPAVSQLGDLWRIGDHYLLCADARMRRATLCFSARKKLRWCSLTRRIMSRSSGMFRDWARISIASSPWPRVK